MPSKTRIALDRAGAGVGHRDQAGTEAERCALAAAGSVDHDALVELAGLRQPARVAAEEQHGRGVAEEAGEAGLGAAIAIFAFNVVKNAK